MLLGKINLKRSGVLMDLQEQEIISYHFESQIENASKKRQQDLSRAMKTLSCIIIK